MNNHRTSPVTRGVMLWFPLLLVALAFCAPTSAEPAWKKELTSPAPGSHPPIPPGTLDFQLSWNGLLNSGKLRIEFAPRNAGKPGVIVVRSSAASLGPASALFPYQNNFWSELDPTSLKPRLFQAVETDNEATTTTTTRHFPDRVECTENKTLPANPTPTRKDRVFKFSPVFDIFSAMLHVRSRNLHDGDLITLVVHPFKNPYLLRVKVIAHEAHLDRKTIRLSVGMQKINLKTLELLPYKKMSGKATLWLSDDSDRIPVEFRAAIFIGDIRATLTGYQKS